MSSLELMALEDKCNKQYEQIIKLNDEKIDLIKENQELKALYDKALSDCVKTTKILMELEKWLKSEKVAILNTPTIEVILRKIKLLKELMNNGK